MNNGSLEQAFRIVRLSDRDAAGSSDHFCDFRSLVLDNDPMYPGIRKWFEEKVVPGLKAANRAAYVGYLNEKPTVSAVVKLGENAKFCHLRIAEELRNAHLGDLFFSIMAMEVRRVAKRVYFTLPESLWETKGGFFRSFGFSRARKAATQYRRTDAELQCSAPFENVWKSVLGKLPKLAGLFSVGGYSLANALLMSIRPRHSDCIMSGKKTVEIRKVFSNKWMGSRVSMYASGPVCGLVGEATIGKVVVGKPCEIWAEYWPGMCCTKEEFDRYVGSAEQVSALILEDVRPYEGAVYIEQLVKLLCQPLSPPQSYCALGNNQGWARAVSVAALLHGSMRHQRLQPMPCDQQVS